jgi:FkbM family methyltransferase
MIPAGVRRTAGIIKRELFPSPALAAWRRACAAAAAAPRFTEGEITLGPYSIRYPDLLTLCPQWRDIFVDRSLAFRSSRRDPRILDCGANVGLASLFFKAEYPHARITAFEADPAIARMLAANLRSNGAEDIDVVHAAVWTNGGTLPFRPDGADGGAIASTRPAATKPPINVPAVRLRALLERERVDLLKLDIEGAEADVLEDCAPHLNQVAALHVEVHEFDPIRRRSTQLFALLDRVGFSWAATHITPTPDGKTAAGPFPQRSPRYVLAAVAWRSDAV